MVLLNREIVSIFCLRNIRHQIGQVCLCALHLEVTLAQVSSCNLKYIIKLLDPVIILIVFNYLLVEMLFYHIQKYLMRGEGDKIVLVGCGVIGILIDKLVNINNIN